MTVGNQICTPPVCVCVCLLQINSWQVSPFPVHVHEHTHTHLRRGNASWTGLIHSIKLYYPKRLGQMNEDSHYSATVCVRFCVCVVE